MRDTATTARYLRSAHLLRMQVTEDLLALLGVSPGQRILDLGCGAGHVTGMVARLAGKDGLVVGLDRDSGIIALGQGANAQPGSRAALRFVLGDAVSLPFSAQGFDLVLSVDCLGYSPPHLPAMVAQLRELGRVLRPGGTCALACWLSQTLLPGHAELEARLNLTCQGMAPWDACPTPRAHLLRGLGWLREAGYDHPRLHALSGVVPGPLSPDVREAMLDLFAMRWGDPSSEIEPRWRDEYERLTRSDSASCILDAPDYAAVFTYVVLMGRWAPESPVTCLI